MEIVVNRTISVNKDSPNDNRTIYIPGKGKRKDRRKNKHDRRKSVRDGVYVTLSFKKDRRVVKDRRKADQG
jgi:hypothetical protein